MYMFIRVIRFAHVPTIFRLDFELALTVWYIFVDHFIRPLLTIFQLFCGSRFYLGRSEILKKNVSNGQTLSRKFATGIPSYMRANWIHNFVNGTTIRSRSRIFNIMQIYVVFSMSLFVLLPFFVWSLHCLSFDLRLMITLLESLFNHCLTSSDNKIYEC